MFLKTVSLHVLLSLGHAPIFHYSEMLLLSRNLCSFSIYKLMSRFQRSYCDVTVKNLDNWQSQEGIQQYCVIVYLLLISSDLAR